MGASSSLASGPLLTATCASPPSPQDTVLITGAAMGLGKGLASRFAALGCKIVLWDINYDLLVESECERERV